jgi:hypothetical protein
MTDRSGAESAQLLRMSAATVLAVSVVVLGIGLIRA